MDNSNLWRSNFILEMSDSISSLPISKRIKTALENAGFKFIDDFKGKSLDDIKKIKGIGSNGQVELREYLHVKYGIIFKPASKQKVTKNFKHSQQIVSYFLKDCKKILWGKEIKTADQLISIYGFDLLMSVKLSKRIFSLSFFFTDEGKKCIKQSRPALAIESSINYKHLESEDTVELAMVANTHKAPKSIRDFLK